MIVVVCEPRKENRAGLGIVVSSEAKPDSDSGHCKASDEYHAAWKADNGRDARHEASIAKLAGAGMIWRVVDRVMQIHGGMGYTKEMPIERVMRDVRVYRIYEGTDEIQRRSIARNLVKGHATLSAWS